MNKPVETGNNRAGRRKLYSRRHDGTFSAACSLPTPHTRAESPVIPLPLARSAAPTAEKSTVSSEFYILCETSCPSNCDVRHLFTSATGRKI